MEELQNYRQRLLERLSSIVDDLEDALAEIPPHALPKSTGPGGWSPHQEIAFLRDIQAQVYLPRFKRIVAGEELEWGEFDRLEWSREIYDPDEPLGAVIPEYRDLRQEEAEWLKGAPSWAWNRTARHPVWASRTLGWWVERGLALAEGALSRIREAGTLKANWLSG